MTDQPEPNEPQPSEARKALASAFMELETTIARFGFPDDITAPFLVIAHRFIDDLSRVADAAETIANAVTADMSAQIDAAAQGKAEALTQKLLKDRTKRSYIGSKG